MAGIEKSQAYSILIKPRARRLSGGVRVLPTRFFIALLLTFTAVQAPSVYTVLVFVCVY